MLRITQRAIDHLARLRTERGVADAQGARLHRSHTTDRIRLAFVPGPQPGDRIMADRAVPVYIARQLDTELRDATIDTSTTEGRTSLRVRRRTGAQMA